MTGRPSPEELLALLEGGQRERFVEVTADLADHAGLPAVVALLAAVQREVGGRWQAGTWSVADEHAASAVVDIALTVASCRASPPEPAGRLVVACAEEEWHVLPARMLAEELRALGWAVTFVGASVPADHLAAYLRAKRPHSCLVSCSVVTHLPGAQRAIAASHRAGVAAVAGGAAFGDDAVRADALGADGWAASARQVDELCRHWLEHPPALAPGRDGGAALAIAADRPEAVDRVLAGDGAGTTGPRCRWPSGTVAARAELDFTVRVVEAAVATGDDRIVVEHARWWVPYLAALGVPASTAVDSLGALGRALVVHPLAVSLLELAAAEVRQA